jgi:hypothetical protein
MLVNIYEFHDNRHAEVITFLTGVGEITLAGKKVFYSTLGKLRVI